MKGITAYIRQYLAQASLPVHCLSAIFLSFLIYVNYAFGLNRAIYALPQPLPFFVWYALLFGAFALPYLLFRFFDTKRFAWSKQLYVLVLLAPFVFAWKMTAPVKLFPEGYTYFLWNSTSYFTIKALVVTGMLLLLRMVCGKDETLMGLRSPAYSLQPYMLMLALMVPLIAAAATQADFLAVYPKIRSMTAKADLENPMKVLLFEAAYGIDFFTIELFFRGFLVIYFARWAGTRSILPMAVFYCVIHFGKPLGECISSFFGGMLLGIVSYHTRSIWGGLAVHLGIAWLMELAGWLSLYPLSP